MPVFHIPSIGDKIQVAEDWTFTLYAEHRNAGLLKALGMWDDNGRWHWSEYEDDHSQPPYHTGKPRQRIKDYGEVTIPEGTVLTVDRIYIRKGVKDYDSITFILNKKTCSDERIKTAKGTIRFWVKLPEVNGVFFQEAAA